MYRTFLAVKDLGPGRMVFQVAVFALNPGEGLNRQFGKRGRKEKRKRGKKIEKDGFHEKGEKL
jgi:hypothetical protein